MDRQSMDHVSTLCALGTIGAAPVGLAFGFEQLIPPTRPGTKRKALPSGTLEPRRVVSQPEKIDQTRPQTRPGFPVPLFRRKTYQDAERLSTASTTTSTSRQSSPFGRHLHSRGGQDGVTADKKDARPISWIRRMSSLSGISPAPSTRPNTPSVTISNTSATPMWATEETRPSPNKLVKRSSSQRVLSAVQTHVPALRRPATSHQRKATLQQLSQRPSSSLLNHAPSLATDPDQVWLPYFDSGDAAARSARSRKRHTSGALEPIHLRVVSDTSGRCPTLLLGTSIARRPESELDDSHEQSREPSPPPVRRRLRYSLSNARRGIQRRSMTDPIKQGSFLDNSAAFTGGSSPLSPISHMSPFEVQLPRGTPSYPGSPFADSGRVVSAPNGRVSHSKRVSVAPSDPNSMNMSSDNDTRVFTDDESYEFQSDTAYDSLATRATASSHSGLKGPQIETIFDESPPSEPPKELVTLRDLIGRGALDADMERETNSYPGSRAPNIGIGITGWEEEDDNDYAMGDAPTQDHATPIKSGAIDEDDELATPMTVVRHKRTLDMNLSPPSMVKQPIVQNDIMEDVRHSIETISISHNGTDWDKETDPESTFDESFSTQDLPRHSANIGRSWSPNLELLSIPEPDGHHVSAASNQKPSIFDWSEHQRFESDTLNGSSPRPKTVHGKQGLDGRGSRAPGRRGPSTVHLRSQSVPVNRESSVESETTTSIAKFGTWGLGNKGVSEEWNDDFDFDDFEDALDVQDDHSTYMDGTLRGMKVPQAIIDRQDSVHGQFGQVQEFMLLVEELKRLRVQGATFRLLESQSRQLWEDAESIINLATLNDDDGNLRPPQSPTFASFDEFDEDSPQQNRPAPQSKTRIEDTKRRDSATRRSISSPATPPSGRPRGESLAQAKTFLQAIHQGRNGVESSPAEVETHEQKKLPFDTQDLRDLVVRAGVITRALKEIIRKAEGVSLSPEKTPQRFTDPAFSQIFIRPDESPSPTFKKPALPKSRSANSYLGAPVHMDSEGEISGHLKMMTVV